MSLSADAVAILHCEADRLRSVVVGEGGILPDLPQTTQVTPDFASGIAAVGAYALTMWELDLLRALGYPVFNQTFDALRHFVDYPDPGALDSWGLAFAALFAGAADRRSVPAGCQVQSISFPGLSPPDDRILPQNLTEDEFIPQSGGDPDSTPVPLPIIAGIAAAVGMLGVVVYLHLHH